MINFVSGLNSMNLPIQRRESWTRFWIIWILIQLGLGWGDYWMLEPYGMHQGAQADRACVGWNFFHETWDFFLPRVMENRAAEGIAGMEFPILAYLSGIFGRIFGFGFFVHRFLVGTILSAGIWSLYKLLAWMRVGFISRWFILSLLFLSPVFVFYTWNFLADAAALGFVFMGIYAWFRLEYMRGGLGDKLGALITVEENGKSANYYRNIVLLSSLFAGLLKVSMLVFFIAILLLELWEIVVLRKPKKPVFQHSQDGDYWVIEDDSDVVKGNAFVGFLGSVVNIAWVGLVLGLIGGWYYYAGWLTKQTWNVHFLQQVNPAESWKVFKDVVDFSWNSWKDRLYPTTLILGIFIGWIYVLVKNRKDGWQKWEQLSVLVALGTACFFVLFAKQFRFHDYYYLVFWPWIFLAILTIYVDQIYGRFMFRGMVGVLSLIGLFVYPFVLMGSASKMLNYSFKKGHYFCQNAIDDTQELRSISRIINRLDPLDTTEVLIVGDPSPNTGLLMLGKKGIRLAPDFDSVTIQDVIHHKLKQEKQFFEWKRLGLSEAKFKEELFQEYYWQLKYNKGRRIAWIIIFDNIEDWPNGGTVERLVKQYMTEVKDNEVRMWNAGDHHWKLYRFEANLAN